MGSLPSPPPPSPLTSSPESSLSRYRIYIPFCSRETRPNANISNWIECYNPIDNSWDHVSFIPGLIENHVLKDFAMVSLGGSVYIIGGRLCRTEEVLDSNEFDELTGINEEILSNVSRYDIQTEQWYECAPLIVPRYDFACIVCNNKIYVAGGQSTLSGARGVSSAEMYNPSLDEWTSLPNMSTRRYKCVGMSWQGKIHVVGGFAERGDSNKIVPWVERSSAEVYDVENRKWDLVVGMWQLDVPPNQIVNVDGKLFSSGDCLNAWKGHIEAFDGKLNIWYVVDGSQLEIPSSPTSTSYGGEERWPSIQRFYLTMAPIGTHLYFLAGYRMGRDSSRTKSRVHVFDTSATARAWRSVEAFEQEGQRELCSHCCVVQLP
ncbi:hypothetical protein NMG60_11012653 [Bertholletia excelsa]